LIEIGEVETHFTLPGRGDFDQPAAPRETVDGAAEHDAANNIEDDIRALSTGRRANFRREVLSADDHLLRYGAERRAPVSADPRAPIVCPA
jgi:hypothetical protein